MDTTGCGSPPRPAAGRSPSSVDRNGAATFVTVYLIGAEWHEGLRRDPLARAARHPAAGHHAGRRPYALRCVFSSGTVRTSRRIAVTGATTGAVAGYRPLPDLALTGAGQPPTAPGSKRRCPTLLTASRGPSNTDVARGDLAPARPDWLAAHLDYERLGAAYNSFGDFDDEINGMANGLPRARPARAGPASSPSSTDCGTAGRPDRLRPLTRTLVDDR